MDKVSVSPRLALRQVDGVAFPSYEFDNVPLNLLADPAARYQLAVVQQGQISSNVWLYASDAQPPDSSPATPTGYSDLHPQLLDARIQTVWPHDVDGSYSPASEAGLINVAVDVFAHGTLNSLSIDSTLLPSQTFSIFNSPSLWETIDSDPHVYSAGTGARKTSYVINGAAYPRWVFNDVGVTPGRVYSFFVSVGPVGQPGGGYPNIWTHAPPNVSRGGLSQAPVQCGP
jgi:hypothetical protein